MKHGGILPFMWEQDTCTCSNPDELPTRYLVLFVNIHFNIILPSRIKLSKCPFYSKIFTKHL